MAVDINRETIDDRHPVEQSVSIQVGAAVYRFAVVVPRYIMEKLKAEDWMRAGTLLKAERDRHMQRAVLTGDYFTEAGIQAVRDRVRQSMCDLIYEQFKLYQIRAGNEAWAVPPTLQGAR